MPTINDAQDWRDYLLATPEARAIFDRISQIVQDQVEERVRSRGGAPHLSLADEEWLTNVCRNAAQAVASSANNMLTVTGDQLRDITTQVILDNHPLGPLMPLLREPKIQNIHVNGPKDCYYFIDGERFYAPLSFKDSEDVMNRLVEFFNSQSRSAPISQAHPIGTLILPTGERCHVASGVCDPDPLITLRKHQPDRFADFGKLAEVGGMPWYVARFLNAVVKARLNVLFAGGVNTGKTTYLRAFGAGVPKDERLGVVEDDRELMLGKLRPGTDTFELSSRPPNTEGLGGIGMDVLIREALRMNANRMIVGEVRGKEALYMLKAMSSGWNGSACTIHAEVAEDAIPQLIGYVFEHEDAPKNEEQVAKKVARAIHLIVFLRAVRISEGRERRVLDKVVAVYGWSAGEINMQTIVEYDELRDEWFWMAQRPTEIGNEDWQRRFRNAGINLADIIPQDVVDKGMEYYRDREEDS